ncbi:sugar phosphate isomerase/epimerase family protein [Roseinatronobacter sp. NSM]|uniref:sugar phosphate isomerase/epimerase family protein n=1 Tax=Roseinatronobacter sp. NSM TaxID=3457785 RepID=UPI0040358E41
MTRTLSLAHLSAIDLPPPELVRAAAQAGFDAVGLRLLRVTDDSPGYALMDDRALMQGTLQALAQTGLSVSDIEFVRITPELDPDALLPLLDAGAELGARHLICAPYDDDLARLGDRLDQIGAHCAARGLSAVLEFFPWTPVPDLGTCWDVVQGCAPHVGVLLDVLHFDRSASTLDQIAQIPPARLPFVHVCDAPRHPPYTTQDLLHSARQDRLPPGAGQIDIAAILAALPPDTPLGLEVPMARHLPVAQHLRRLFDSIAGF